MTNQPPAAPPTPRDQRTIARESQRAYIRTVLDETGLSLRALAIEAGVSPTTLSRFMNEPGHDGLLSADTLTKLSAYAGVGWEPPSGADFELLARPNLPAELTAMLMKIGDNIALIRAPDQLMAGRGILKGDVAVVDAGREPVAGDVVAAWVAGRTGRPSETILRLYLQPNLVACPLAPEATDERRPVLVDGLAAQIKGVVTGVVRWAA